MSDAGTEPPREVIVPLTSFVTVNFRRASGQNGTLYVKADNVVAVADNGEHCLVQLVAGAEWLHVNMTADAFLDLIGGAT